MVECSNSEALQADLTTTPRIPESRNEKCPRRFTNRLCKSRFLHTNTDSDASLSGIKTNQSASQQNQAIADYKTPSTFYQELFQKAGNRSGGMECGRDLQSRRGCLRQPNQLRMVTEPQHYVIRKPTSLGGLFTTFTVEPRRCQINVTITNEQPPIKAGAKQSASILYGAYLQKNSICSQTISKNRNYLANLQRIKKGTKCWAFSFLSQFVVVFQS